MTHCEKREHPNYYVMNVTFEMAKKNYLEMKKKLITQLSTYHSYELSLKKSLLLLLTNKNVSRMSLLKMLIEHKERERISLCIFGKESLELINVANQSANS